MIHFDASEVQEIVLNDTNYPKLLRAIRNPPKSLRFRGSLPPNRKIIAISGSRKPTQQEALQTAFRVGKMLAEHGYTIVTGLAEGCDAAASEGALSAGGDVIGVVPFGLKALPTDTKNLAQEIFATGGAVISEYADNFSKVFPRHYLRRNEIITGLSEKTIIVAADERSGSSATANRALRQGRKVIVTPHVNATIEGTMIVKKSWGTERRIRDRPLRVEKVNRQK